MNAGLLLQDQTGPAERPSSGVVRCYSFLETGSDFATDVLTGLTAARKTLPARWRYDLAGMRALQALYGAPEYYLGRAETELLAMHLPEVATYAGLRPHLIEFGPAMGLQSELLIDMLRPGLYVTLAVDPQATESLASRLSRSYPMLHIAGLIADPAKVPVLPEFVGAECGRRLVFLSASAGTSYTPGELVDVLRHARRIAGPEGMALAAIDLKKNRKVLEAAHADAEGYAARLNVSLLDRINRELDADFQLARFRHVAVHDEILGCTGLYLETDTALAVRAGQRRIFFQSGEAMLTGIATHYGNDEFRAMAMEAGFTPGPSWLHSSRSVALCLLNSR